jgi:hypothetical protein
MRCQLGSAPAAVPGAPAHPAPQLEQLRGRGQRRGRAASQAAACCLCLCLQAPGFPRGTVIKTKPRVERNRVLVTGGAGFVGSHLCEFLVTRGDHVRVAVCCPGRLQGAGGMLGSCVCLLPGCPACCQQLPLRCNAAPQHSHRPTHTHTHTHTHTRARARQTGHLPGQLLHGLQG